MMGDNKEVGSADITQGPPSVGVMHGHNTRTT